MSTNNTSVSLDFSEILDIACKYETINEFERAEKLYLKIIEIDNEHIEALFKLGYLYHRNMINLEKAEEYYLRAVDKDHVMAAYYLGILYFESNKKKDAEKYNLKTIELNEEYREISWIGDVLNRLGRIYEEFGNRDKCIEYYMRAIDECDNNHSKLNLGHFYFSEKNYAEALVYYSKYNSNMKSKTIDEFIEKCRENLKSNRKLEKIYTDIATGCCSICSEPFIGTSSGLDTFLCGHSFHKKCIDKWIRAKDKDKKKNIPTCPECREEIEL
jgi:Tfp pilus assembly protein PilF